MMPARSDAGFDKQQYASLRAAVRTIKDSAAPLKDRIEAIHVLHNYAGWGENAEEALKAGAIEALVSVSTGGWPEGGDLAASSCLYDEVEPGGDPEAAHRGRHSMRRAAVCALADMCNYQPLAARVVAAGMFEGMGRMLGDALRRYRYGQSLRSMEFSTDQVQHIAERLLNICAGVVGMPAGGQQVMARCGDVILDSYDVFAGVAAAAEEEKAESEKRLNPVAAAVAAAAAAAEAAASAAAAAAGEPLGSAAAGGGSGGGGSGRASGGDVIVDVDQGDFSEFMPGWGGEDGDDDERSPMPDNFCRFWCNGMRWLTSPTEQDRLVGKGLVGKLRQVDGGLMSGKGMALAALDPAFIRFIEREAKRVGGDLKEVAETGKLFRQQGNEAFQAGSYEEAVAAYDQGIGYAPQDPLLHANRSLALIKMGRYQESLESAQDATQFGPARPKYWGRMGDAHRGLGQHACALLCYEQAAKLAPRDEEILQRKQAAEAAVAPADRIDVASLPRQSDMFQDQDWIQRLQAMDFDELGDKMDEEVDLVTRKMLGLPADSQEDWQQTPSGMAMRSIVPLMDLVQSAATVGSLPRSQDMWCVSWSDMRFMEGQQAPMFMTSLMAGHEKRASVVRAGRPTAPLIVQVLKLGMTHPEAPACRPERPAWILVAHRMKAEYAAIEAEMRKIGVMCQLESREEAEATAAAHGTNPDGFNFAEDEAIMADP